MWRRLAAVFALWRLFAPPPVPRFVPGQVHPWRLPGRSVFVGDREFVVRETGAGAPLVLIHGLGGSSLAEWYKIAPMIEGRRIVLVEHRNHGLAPKTTDAYTIDDLADDVAGVMEKDGIESADVAGYSMGGAVALALAHRHPRRVRSLSLIASLDRTPQPARTGRRIFTILTRMWERLTGVGTPEVRYAYLRGVGAVEPRHARWLWDETHRRNPETGAVASQALLSFDGSAWSGRLAIPILVFITTRDQLVPPRWQYDMAHRLGHATIVELVGARHEAPWTHAPAIAAALRDFLDG